MYSSVLPTCSVGGLDYSTVRTGAFMGLQLLSNLEDTLSRQSSWRGPVKADHGADENGNAHCAIGRPLADALQYLTVMLTRASVTILDTEGFCFRAVSGLSESQSLCLLLLHSPKPECAREAIVGT